MSDANIDAAARAVVSGAFSNSGQSCVSTERVIVHKDIAPQFLQKVKSYASKVTAGPDGKIGGVFTEVSAENIIGMVKEAVNGGAELLVGDLKRQGTYVQPHVVVGSKPGDRLWDRETFGPGMLLLF